MNQIDMKDITMKNKPIDGKVGLEVEALKGTVHMMMI